MELKKTSCCGTSKAASMQPEEIKEYLKKRYGAMVKAPAEGTCCGTTRDHLHAKVALLAGYTEEQLAGWPAHVLEYSFGCGNPVALACIQPGQTVLDIGSGAGIDVLLAAPKVGPEGHVIGLDITPEMIDVAKRNAHAAGATNVEFRLGDAEDMPVESDAVDWVISNWVVNFATDKGKVFREAYRVLRPAGRMLVSDIVTHDLPEDMRQSAAARISYFALALGEYDYLDAIRGAGLSEVEIVARLDYSEETVRSMICENEPVPDELARLAQSLAGRISSIKVSAVKP